MSCDDGHAHPNVNGCSVGGRESCDSPLHGTPYQVCGDCAQDTLQQQFVLDGRRWIRRRNRPANPSRPFTSPLAIHTSPHPGFLTRLCRYCERRERKLLYARQARAEAPEYRLPRDQPPGSNVEAALMHEAPYNMCTCLRRLKYQNHIRITPNVLRVEHGYRHCLIHRKRLWNQMILKKEANVSIDRIRYRNNGDFC